MKRNPKRVDLTIPMVEEMELTATQTAEALGRFMGWNQEKTDETKMALIEACLNAFEHSNSEDRRVLINFELSEEAMTIRIGDSGNGFDPEFARKEAVRKREQGESRRGWGLKIMEEMMDEVDIQSDQSGTVITLVKRR
jgi:serine/threonine-protein kinase RsbW